MRQSPALHVRTLDDDSDIMIFKFESVILSLSYFFPPVWTRCQDFWKRQKQKKPRKVGLFISVTTLFLRVIDKGNNKFVPHLYFSVPLPPRAANSIIAFPPFFWHFPWQYLSGDLTKNLRSNIALAENAIANRENRARKRLTDKGERGEEKRKPEWTRDNSSRPRQMMSKGPLSLLFGSLGVLAIYFSTRIMVQVPHYI